MTTRKTRSRNHASSTSQPPIVSDYDSEAQYTAPGKLRTREEINHSVLKRYVPSLSAILEIAASAYIYTLNNTTGEWERTGIEGTLFVCELTPSPITGKPRHCIVVLNRKGLENLIVFSEELQNVEISDEFLLLKFRSRQNENEFVQETKEQEKILGLFMTADGDAKERVCLAVKSHWEMAMRERESGEGMEGMMENFGDEGYSGGGVMGEVAGESKPMGRRLSLTELFGHR
jgi:Dcp1-like decapping family